ncbi:MAG: hypothetical protein ACQESR_13220, partial [Planctomycetota bacterium]
VPILTLLISRNIILKRTPNSWNDWRNGVSASVPWSVLNHSIRSNVFLEHGSAEAIVCIWM